MQRQADIWLTRDSEWVVEVDALTDAGADFVDAYLGAMVVVIDVGRIVIPAEDESTFVAAAHAQGLVV